MTVEEIALRILCAVLSKEGYQYHPGSASWALAIAHDFKRAVTLDIAVPKA